MLRQEPAMNVDILKQAMTFRLVCAHLPTFSRLLFRKMTHSVADYVKQTHLSVELPHDPSSIFRLTPLLHRSFVTSKGKNSVSQMLSEGMVPRFGCRLDKYTSTVKDLVRAFVEHTGCAAGDDQELSWVLCEVFQRRQTVDVDFLSEDSPVRNIRSSGYPPLLIPRYDIARSGSVQESSDAAASEGNDTAASEGGDVAVSKDSTGSNAANEDTASSHPAGGHGPDRTLDDPTTEDAQLQSHDGESLPKPELPGGISKDRPHVDPAGTECVICYDDAVGVRSNAIVTIIFSCNILNGVVGGTRGRVPIFLRQALGLQILCGAISRWRYQLRTSTALPFVFCVRTRAAHFQGDQRSLQFRGWKGSDRNRRHCWLQIRYRWCVKPTASHVPSLDSWGDCSGFCACPIPQRREGCATGGAKRGRGG